MNVTLKEFSREPRCSLTDLSSFSPPKTAMSKAAEKKKGSL